MCSGSAQKRPVWRRPAVQSLLHSYGSRFQYYIAFERGATSILTMRYATTALLVALANTVSAQAGDYQQCKFAVDLVVPAADT
jgi:hypothetical protein